jgi:hypothetical protein
MSCNQFGKRQPSSRTETRCPWACVDSFGCSPSVVGSVDFSICIIKARLCRWYGRSFSPSAKPSGSGCSIGNTCQGESRVAAHARACSRQQGWRSAPKKQSRRGGGRTCSSSFRMRVQLQRSSCVASPSSSSEKPSRAEPARGNDDADADDLLAVDAFNSRVAFDCCRARTQVSSVCVAWQCSSQLGHLEARSSQT